MLLINMLMSNFMLNVATSRSVSIKLLVQGNNTLYMIYETSQLIFGKMCCMFQWVFFGVFCSMLLLMWSAHIVSIAFYVLIQEMQNNNY